MKLTGEKQHLEWVGKGRVGSSSKRRGWCTAWSIRDNKIPREGHSSRAGQGSREKQGVTHTHWWQCKEGFQVLREILAQDIFIVLIER